MIIVLLVTILIIIFVNILLFGKREEGDIPSGTAHTGEEGYVAKKEKTPYYLNKGTDITGAVYGPDLQASPGMGWVL